MITLTKSLPTVALCLSDEVTTAFECSHDNGASFERIGQICKIIFDDAFTYPDAKISIGWHEQDETYHSLTFFFRDEPTQVEELSTWHEYDPPRPLFIDHESYINHVAVEMRHHPFSVFFKIMTEKIGINQTAIILEASETIKNFTVDTENLSVSFIEIAASPYNIPPYYRFLYEVYAVESSSTLSPQLFSGYGVPDSKGIVALNIKDILKNYMMSRGFTPPNPNLKTPHIAPNRLKYFIRYTEEFGAPVERKGWIWSNTTFAIYANKFSHWALVFPDEKIIGLDTPELLAWTNISNSNRIIKRELEITDRSTSEIITFKSEDSTSVPAFQTAVIPFPFIETDLSNAAFIRVRLLDYQDSPITDWRTYNIDSLYYQETKHLMFLNHYGVWETVRFTGSVGNTSDVKRKEATKFKGAKTATETTDVDWSRTFAYRSGWLSEEESFAMEHLVSSPFVCEISPEGYLPLRILDTKFTPDDGQKERFSWDIKATPVENFHVPTSIFFKSW
jgi:hypothetical protein